MFNIQDFCSQVSEVKKSTTPEERLAVDKERGKFFNTPGVFEVTSKGYQPFMSKAGKEYFAIPVESDDGKAEKVMVNLTTFQTGEPNVMSMQLMLKAFGFTWSQAQIRLAWNPIISALPAITQGKVFIAVSFKGYVVDYKEQGVYGIRDFGPGAKDYPDNFIIDPNNGDTLIFGSREEAETFATSKGIKLGKKEVKFLKPSEGMVWTKDQQKVAEAMDTLLNEEPVVEKPVAKTTAWRPGQK